MGVGIFKTFRKYLTKVERLRKPAGRKERCPEAKISQNKKNKGSLDLLHI